MAALFLIHRKKGNAPENAALFPGERRNIRKKALSPPVFAILSVAPWAFLWYD